MTKFRMDKSSLPISSSVSYPRISNSEWKAKHTTKTGDLFRRASIPSSPGLELSALKKGSPKKVKETNASKLRFNAIRESLSKSKTSSPSNGPANTQNSQPAGRVSMGAAIPVRDNLASMARRNFHNKEIPVLGTSVRQRVRIIEESLKRSPFKTPQKSPNTPSLPLSPISEDDDSINREEGERRPSPNSVANPEGSVTHLPKDSKEERDSGSHDVANGEAQKPNRSEFETRRSTSSAQESKTYFSSWLTYGSLALLGGALLYLSKDFLFEVLPKTSLANVILPSITQEIAESLSKTNIPLDLNSSLSLVPYQPPLTSSNPIPSLSLSMDNSLRNITTQGSLALLGGTALCYFNDSLFEVSPKTSLAESLLKTNISLDLNSSLPLVLYQPSPLTSSNPIPSLPQNDLSSHLRPAMASPLSPPLSMDNSLRNITTQSVETASKGWFSRLLKIETGTALKIAATLVLAAGTIYVASCAYSYLYPNEEKTIPLKAEEALIKIPETKPQTLFESFISRLWDTAASIFLFFSSFFSK